MLNFLYWIFALGALAAWFSGMLAIRRSMLGSVLIFMSASLFGLVSCFCLGTYFQIKNAASDTAANNALNFSPHADNIALIGFVAMASLALALAVLGISGVVGRRRLRRNGTA